MVVRIFLLVLVAGHLLAQPDRPIKPAKKEKERATQALPALPEPPAAVVADATRLVFHVSPLSAKGLLSQQIRDALKSLDRDNHGAQIVKLRAFVAGTGDMRRVQQIVSETFAEKKLALPVVTTIQVGALPLEGAQVVIESAAVDKRAGNPDGLVFLPPMPVERLPANILMATCFMKSLDGLPSVPAAAVDFVQLTRVGGSGPGVCEAVARESGGWSKLVFSGLQLVFREQDVELAMDRLKRAVEPLGGRMEGAVVSLYGVMPGAGRLVVEGLPALDAVVGVEADARVE